MNTTREEFHWRKLPGEILRGIATRERDVRKNQRLSQEELAKRSGVSLGSLKRFENTGKISLESLVRLAFTLKSTEGLEQIFQMHDTPKSLDELL